MREGSKHTPETRAKISQKGTNRKWSEESRRRLSETRKRLFAEGKLRAGQRKITQVPEVVFEDDALGHWIAGFVDGEGCFAVSKRPRGGIQCLFALALRRDDEKIVRLMQKEVGLGSVTFSRNKAGTQVVRWSVHSYAGCMALSHFFEKYPLRSKKKRDFTAWKSIVEKGFHTYKPLYKDFEKELEIMREVKEGFPFSSRSPKPGKEPHSRENS